MKQFIEKVNAWFLILLLIGCSFFIALLAGESGLVSLTVAFLLFLFLFVWLIYQSKKEKKKFFIIVLCSLFLAGIILSIVYFIDKATQPEKRLPIDLLERLESWENLPKDIIKIHGLRDDFNRKLIRSQFYLDVENISDKYCIKKIRIELVVFKDGIAFYKDVNESSNILNPLCKTEIGYFLNKNYVSDVDPTSFPEKPWTFSTTIKSIRGELFSSDGFIPDKPREPRDLLLDEQ